MSYAIIRNEKLTRSNAIGAYNHNERKTKNHTNKNIDPTRTHLNFYLKKNELSYIHEFDRIKKEYNLKGQIKTTSNIMCELMITSDQKFFDTIGYVESKRYFDEAYKFICNYKNLGEQNIISAVVHMDEDSPHMHLLFIPVVHTTDKQGNPIDKVSCRDFWHGKNTYGQLQDKFYENIVSKGFKLEQGQPKEVTNREHYSMEEYKKITNYENTKKVLRDITLDIPNVPDIKDFNKLMMNKTERIQKEIIEPKDNLIEKLYASNRVLHKELSKQAKVIDKATEYEIEYDSIIAYNKELEDRCNTVEKEFVQKSNNLDVQFNNKVYDLEKNFEAKTTEFKRELRKDYYELEKENRHLKRIVSTVKSTIDKFIKWVCRKFDMSAESVMRDFEKENRIYLDPVMQIQKEDREKEWDMER